MNHVSLLPCARRSGLVVLSVVCLVGGLGAHDQPQRPAANPLPATPLSQAVLDLLANEVSGQMAFNNQVTLAGAPWQRDAREFTGTFDEVRDLHDIIRAYGIETVRIDRSPGTRTIDYPAEGELWIEKPERRLIARLGADAALVASGSKTGEATGPLLYVPPLTEDRIKALAAGVEPDKYRGRWVLMWSHPSGEAARALDAAGVVGVIAFNARERYFDPNQVVYSSGAYAQSKTMTLGMTLSWRQWSELLEDVEAGRQVVVRGRARVDRHQDRFETVVAWIPGTEPEAKGVILTGHLFEGYTKRGANDNMSSVAVQTEILRALTSLIARGALPRPRRTITFVWPNEISGTYEFLKRNPGIVDRLSININMDMVGEALRKNNAVFTMSECPNHLPCYLDGLSKSLFDYVWRTNDIVYLPDSPRGRPGGQYLPRPMWEKNGSLDAFRYFIHRATGGSDHVCFNNPSVAVPGVEYFVWPDQWYHADTDTPDKADPTQMKRVAFLGAAAAWTAALCTDEVLAPLLDAVSAFGHARVAERELPQALRLVDQADLATLAARTARALDTIDLAVDREASAIRSTADVHSGSATARAQVENRLQQWELHRSGLRSLVTGAAKLRAAALGLKAVPTLPPDPLEKQYAAILPAIHPTVRGQEFSLTSRPSYVAYLKAHPDAIKATGLSTTATTAVLNYVNGRRAIPLIRKYVAAETGQEVPLQGVVAYLEILKAVGWVTY